MKVSRLYSHFKPCRAETQQTKCAKCVVYRTVFTCARDRALGGQLKLYSHKADELGALCRWQGCHSPWHKSINHENDLETSF